jgi:hypothetical protein
MTGMCEAVVVSWQWSSRRRYLAVLKLVQHASRRHASSSLSLCDGISLAPTEGSKLGGGKNRDGEVLLR